MREVSVSGVVLRNLDRRRDTELLLTVWSVKQLVSLLASLPVSPLVVPLVVPLVAPSCTFPPRRSIRVTWRKH
jgi:hypothetical protein